MNAGSLSMETTVTASSVVVRKAEALVGLARRAESALAAALAAVVLGSATENESRTDAALTVRVTAIGATPSLLATLPTMAARTSGV